MKYDELKCHDCGKHLGSIIDTGPRGMSFCDKHSDVDTRPQTEQAEASSLSDLLCAWVGVEERLPEFGRKVLVVNDGRRFCAKLEKVTRHIGEDSPIDNRWFASPGWGHQLRNVTAWMEIPTAP